MELGSQLHASVALPPRKEPPVSNDRKLGGEEKISQPLPGIET
jgi:hypothetical protein